MKQKKFPKIRVLTAGMLAFVWWFLFYPELCFPEDTCTIVYQKEAYSREEFENLTKKEQEEIWKQLLQADEEQIIVRSGLLEWWQQTAP